MQKSWHSSCINLHEILLAPSRALFLCLVGSFSSESTEARHVGEGFLKVDFVYKSPAGKQLRCLCDMRIGRNISQRSLVSCLGIVGKIFPVPNRTESRRRGLVLPCTFGRSAIFSVTAQALGLFLVASAECILVDSAECICRMDMVLSRDWNAAERELAYYNYMVCGSF